jgi:hypothetical protein
MQIIYFGLRYRQVYAAAERCIGVNVLDTGNTAITPATINYDCPASHAA